MKKKNVLIIHRGYPIGTNAGDKVRTLNMAKSLNKLGFNVYLLGFYTKGFSLKEKEMKSFPKEIKPIFMYTLPNRLHLQNIASWIRAVITWIICKKYSIDIVQSELASGANCVRFLQNLPLVTDFHSDIVPELEMDNYLPYQVENARKENIYALARSCKTITVSSNLRKNLSVYGENNIPNFILPCNFQPGPYLSLTRNLRFSLRKDMGLENRIVLCYSGGLHVWQCISETLDLVIKLRKINPAYFLCLYTNDDIEPYKDQLKQLEGACLIKSLKHEEVPSHLLLTDIGFVLRAESLVNINSSPTKTSEYLAAGMMVVATQYAGDVPQLIKESGCGFILDNPHVKDQELITLNEKILYFMSNREELAEKARNYVFENRVWSANERLLECLYSDL